MAPTVRVYSVCYWHKAGWLTARKVEAMSKKEALRKVREEDALIFSRLSSVTALY